MDSGAQIERRPRGRVSIYTDTIADQICSEIRKGRSLRAICEGDENLPAWDTVLTWLGKDKYPYLSQQLQHARAIQADSVFDKTLELGKQVLSASPECAQQYAVAIKAFQWGASRLAPKKYGDRQIIENEQQSLSPMQAAQQLMDLAKQLGITLNASLSIPGDNAKVIEHSE
jgi:hypothetical protein